MASDILPPLPPLDGDLLLEVYTHSSLYYEGRPIVEEYGDSERLAVLGSEVLNLAIAQRLFNKRPMMTAAEAKEKREELTSTDNLHTWVTAYNMKKNYKFAPASQSETETPEASRFLLLAYVGGLYCRMGYNPIFKWIDRLVLPDPNELPSSTQPFPPQPSGNPPPLPPTGMTALALFNQTCQQNGYNIEWITESSGPAHAIRWTAKCIVNNVQRGVGTGQDKKLAKEAAVRESATNLGWNNF